jgi:hypothetical protein
MYGQPGVDYTFCISVADPEGDNIFCLWDWGDGSESEWLGPYASGEAICVTHAWSNDGTYSIRVKLKDDQGGESDWSDVFKLVIDGTPPVVNILNRDVFL